MKLFFLQSRSGDRLLEMLKVVWKERWRQYFMSKVPRTIWKITFLKSWASPREEPSKSARGGIYNDPIQNRSKRIRWNCWEEVLGFTKSRSEAAIIELIKLMVRRVRETWAMVVYVSMGHMMNLESPCPKIHVYDITHTHAFKCQIQPVVATEEGCLNPFPSREAK